MIVIKPIEQQPIGYYMYMPWENQCNGDGRSWGFTYVGMPKVFSNEFSSHESSELEFRLKFNAIQDVDLDFGLTFNHHNVTSSYPGGLFQYTNII
jgi:hypothetical protein